MYRTSRCRSAARRLLVPAAATITTLALGACGSDSPSSTASSAAGGASGKQFTVAYITKASDVPFWKWTSDGVHLGADKVGAKVIDYDSKNSSSTQLENAQDAIAKKVDAIVISPNDTSSTAAVLAAAGRAKIPVVIAFIGTDSGTYLASLSSDDKKGAHDAGQFLAETLAKDGKAAAPVGQITVSLAQINGKLRTSGFADAMQAGGHKIVGQLTLKDDTTTANEALAQDLITAHPDVAGLFCQTDLCTTATTTVLKSSGRLNKKTVLAGFDASPDTVTKIEDGTVIAAAVQQPVTVGRMSFDIAYNSIVKKQQPTAKDVVVPTLLVTKDNVAEMGPKLDGTAFTK